jgi:hypothetical protein
MHGQEEHYDRVGWWAHATDEKLIIEFVRDHESIDYRVLEKKLHILRLDDDPNRNSGSSCWWYSDGCRRRRSKPVARIFVGPQNKVLSWRSLGPSRYWEICKLLGFQWYWMMAIVGGRAP